MTRAHDAIGEFADRAITIPNAVTAAVELLDRIVAARPSPPDPQTVRDLILDEAKPAAIDKALLNQVAAQHHRNAWAQAVEVADRRVLAAILDHREHLHAALREQAETIIDRILRCAPITEPLAELIRQGRRDDADSVALLDGDAVELSNLYRVRDQYLTPGRDATERRAAYDVGGYRCDVWRDPDRVEHVPRQATVSGGYLEGIRAGGQLWFPTVEEAREAAQPLFAAWQAEQQAARAAQSGAGSPVAW